MAVVQAAKLRVVETVSNNVQKNVMTITSSKAMAVTIYARSKNVAMGAEIAGNSVTMLTSLLVTDAIRSVRKKYVVMELRMPTKNVMMVIYPLAMDVTVIA